MPSNRESLKRAKECRQRELERVAERASVARNERILFRTSTPERTKLEREARDLGMNLSDYIRFRLLTEE
jgi:hypothetical protein